MARHFVRALRLPLRAVMLALGLHATLRAGTLDGVILQSRIVRLSGPLSPTSTEQCDALRVQVQQLAAESSQAHSACLKHAAPGTEANQGSCANRECQSFHDAIRQVSAKGDELVGRCSAQVREYMAAEHEREMQRLRRVAELERQDRESAAQQAKADAERERRAAQAKGRVETREQQRRADTLAAEQKTRQAQDRHQQEQQRRADQLVNARAAKQLAEEYKGKELLSATRSSMQATRENAERLRFLRTQEAIEANRIRAGHGVLGPVEQAEALAQQRVRQRSLCDDGRCPGTTPSAVLPQLMGDVALEKTQGLVVDTVRNAALRSTGMPTREANDARYDAVTSAVDEARDAALAPNPFAKEASKQGLAAVSSMHKRALGVAEQAGRDMDLVTRSDRQSSSSPRTLISSPAPDIERTRSNAVDATGSANPFEIERPAAADLHGAAPVRNPFGGGGGSPGTAAGRSGALPRGGMADMAEETSATTRQRCKPPIAIKDQAYCSKATKLNPFGPSR